MSVELDKPSKASDPTFDLVVVGGGIHGAWTAFEAARAGARTILVEKGDFGSGVSSNSLKVLHGGLRYLQHMDFARIRESRLSVRSFRALAPHLISDIPFLLETRGRGTRSPLGMRAALFLHGLLGRLWDDGGPSKGGRVMRLDAAKTMGVPVFSAAANGVARWSEAVMVNSERIVFETCRAAAAHGAVIRNYTEAIAVEPSDQGGWLVQLRSGSGGGDKCVRAPVVVEATGSRRENALSVVRAVNLVFEGRPFGDHAVGLESLDATTDPKAVVRSGNRLLFCVPRGRQTMVGTWYDWGKEGDGVVTDVDVDRWISEIETVAPGAGFKRSSLKYLHVGFLPADRGSGDEAVPAKDEGLVALGGGRWSVRSVKYTTAPELARTTVRRLGWQTKPRLHPDQPVPVPDSFDWDSLTEETCPHSPRDLERAAGEEFVVHLDDALCRRSNRALDEPLTDEQRRRAAERLGEALEWDDERRGDEVDRISGLRTKWIRRPPHM